MVKNDNDDELMVHTILIFIVFHRDMIHLHK